ncbi:MAG: hypothetical protein A2504_09210 [Bdellovibrionales bacterium RIFOXYD12_FULL_39_22]|nr:MAG: hypothetical protein A2385_17340 [Bdellovibrionales bacterium RIFOXYB1_FULL_39_21]OFZ41080.1 MAG: hypothetical protein A2485_00265 [Bdellovibrionales bacterium RIFOXYC12_FULL_39_17]OFZ50293.1 MAG: hypothetical protein A2404_07580 [Bdellovibrionales bacterium RIFOXYC1_FULL_39_130]OFZ71819.1 MAG: hypothetical protein A2451_09635 [Bdellovibrionales bacterium RIFOXYC2_FULL_39_8]OFZ75094.1 MAG: hypothetical protein A2560_16275 [Bdellovibrionales bacterium RIFOXYD1_FULL_39_84]OFZ92264.1 MAG:
MTKTIFFNTRGNITLLGIFLAVILSGVMTITIKTVQKNYLAIKSRSNTYLCIKNFTHSSNSIVNTVGKTNSILRSLNLAKKIPKLKIEAEAAILAIYAGQNIAHLAYLKKIALYPRCASTTSAILAIKTPYQHAFGVPLRDANGIIKPRALKWKIDIPLSGRSTLSSLFIQLKLELNSPFSSQLVVQSRENSLPAFLQ